MEFKTMALNTKGNITADKRQVLRVWVNYITQLYGQHN
jgi:hypothetical protein